MHKIAFLLTSVKKNLSKQLFLIQNCEKNGYIARHEMSVKNAHFLPAILVKKKPSFFTTAPCSHTTPRSHCMEESQAERGIARLGLGLDRQRKRG
jgi:hypothetical protein